MAYYGRIKIAETGGNKVSLISSTSHVHFPGSVKFTFAVFPASVKLLQGGRHRLEVEVLPESFFNIFDDSISKSCGESSEVSPKSKSGP